MYDSWTSSSFLGSAPHFHSDPSMGGPPMISGDGHWRWNGERWVLISPPEPEPAETPAETSLSVVPDLVPTPEDPVDTPAA